MLKAILFDMDGLIFDTESIYRQSWQFARAEQGLQITDDTYQQFIGVQDPECEKNSRRTLSKRYRYDALQSGTGCAFSSTKRTRHRTKNGI